jgi:cytochrome c-type biogenesis protein CcmH
VRPAAVTLVRHAAATFVTFAALAARALLAAAPGAAAAPVVLPSPPHAAASGHAAAAAKAHRRPRTSLPAIERQVMCVTCKIPLQVAQSEQADLEREYIQGLIDRGEDEAQIKRALVAQYGPTVLALPSTHGFDLAAYLVPLAVVLALVATLLTLLPSWRRRARARAGSGASAVPLSPEDAARLESDLARFD